MFTLRRGTIPVAARQLTVGLSLVLLALGLLAYWAWQSSVRRHQVAIDLLRSHAELATQRLGDRIQNEIYVGATAVFRPLTSRAAAPGSPTLLASRGSRRRRYRRRVQLRAAARAGVCVLVPTSPRAPASSLAPVSRPSATRASSWRRCASSSLECLRAGRSPSSEDFLPSLAAW